MTRYLDRIGRVWEAISAAEGFDIVGFCLDTCHAHAGGNALETIVEDVRKITGRIDLVHCNDSRDEFDSGADRHANFGAGRIDPDLLAAVVRDAGAPVVVRDARRRRRAPRRLRLAARAALASGIDAPTQQDQRPPDLRRRAPRVRRRRVGPRASCRPRPGAR